MTRLQTALLLTLVALASVLAWQMVWDSLAPIASGAASVGFAALASVPEGVWHTMGWTALSAIWWLPCTVRSIRGGSLRHASACSAFPSSRLATP
ncbi:MAG: hypothetical protein AAGK21_12215 [Bacteroidota bacterium]